MLSHLAAHQGTTALATTLCNAANNLSNCFSLELAHSYVVQEEQWLSTHRNNVVNAHCNQILTYHIVTVKQLSNGKLSTNAISTTNQHRLFHVLKRSGRETRTKTTQATNDLRASSCSNSSLNGVNRASALINVNACVSVGNLLDWISGSSHCSPLTALRA